MVEMKLETTIARVIAEGKLRTYDMSGRRTDTDSPHHGGQAVATAAKTQRST
jgi:hypothetical protein